MRDDLQLLDGGDAALVLADPPAEALLFGSYAPVIHPSDLDALRKLLIQRAPPARSDVSRLDAVSTGLLGEAPTDPLEHPGAQGGIYGDACFALLGLASEPPGATDIEGVLVDLGIEVATIDLRDPQLRGISIVGRRHAPLIGINVRFYRGHDAAVRRFTLAHELGHLLLDASRAREWGITSGPWAPLGVEQRANGFAAALLMPERVLQGVAAQMGGSLREPRVLREIARSLEVSVTSLVDRLRNIGLLDHFSADELKEALAQAEGLGPA